MGEASHSIEKLELTWATLGIDPRKVTLDSKGTIIGTLPPSPGSGPAAVRLPTLSIGGGDRRAPELMIGRTLGSGGMGVVRQATQVPLGREVVVKAAQDERRESTGALLLREARVVGALEHPNIIPVHMLGCDERGSPMMVMKRVDGVPWSAIIRRPDHPVLKRDGREPLEFHLQVMMQVCNAVEFAHSRGVLHRDLKPENVMIGSFGEVYVVDWGAAVATRDDWAGILPLARDIDSLVGTPQYMAPEMAGADGANITERTDVYLLGATLHEAVTGEPRHLAAELTEILHLAYLSRPMVYPASVPAELGVICNRATHVLPSRRFASVAELRAALADVLRHRSSAALCREAAARLDGLQALLGKRDEMESVTLDEQTHTQLVECRFAFRQALKEWPENPDARAGLARALELMADYQLARGDHRAASMLVTEMESPPAALRARIEEARQRYDEEKRQVEGLRQLERTLDPRVGRRARASLALAVGLTFSGVNLLHGYAERHGWWKLSLGFFGLEVLSFVVLLGTGFFFARKVLFRTQVNRLIMGTMGFLSVAMLVMTAGCALLGFTARHATVLQLLLIATAVGALSLVERAFAVTAAFYAAGFVAAAAFQSAALEIWSAAHFLGLGYIGVVWRPRARPQGGRP